MRIRKKIGLTPRLVLNSSYYEVREVWDINWSSLILDMGYIPVLLPVSYTESELEELQLDGIIFTGGNDLSSINPDELSIKRDRFEKLVLDFFIKTKIPIIGVCRGMQFIAYCYGDKLEPVRSHVGNKHKLEVTPSSSFSSCLSELEEVNSFHNYALLSAGECWNVIAKSPDGVIEAISHKRDNILAFMWHPERETPWNRINITLMKQFIENK